MSKAKVRLAQAGKWPNPELELSETLESAIQILGAPSSPQSIHRPDVDLLTLEEEKAGLEIALARAEAWEGIRIGIQYTYDQNTDEPEGLGTDQFLGLAVSIPLPVWDQKKGTIEERTASRDETTARLRAAKLEIENSFASAWVENEWVESGMIPSSGKGIPSPNGVIGVLELAAKMKPDIIFLTSEGSFQSSLNPQGIPWNDFKKAADSVKDASDDAYRFNFITFEASEEDTKELKRISNRNGGKTIELKK